MTAPARGLLARAGWAALRALHVADFRWLLPALARMPLSAGYPLAALRGRFNALAGRDWRSMALGFRHIRPQSALAYRELAGITSRDEVDTWVACRFESEARDEFEARLVAAQRVGELDCELSPAGALSLLDSRERGLVLLTPHFESFFLGVAFLARGGAKVNLMTSAVTHDPRVHDAVKRHFTAKYRGLEPYLNGGKLVDMETGSRQFYRMLKDRECLVVLGDAPVLPEGASMEVEFLGGVRKLSGGPLRMAQSTGSELGGFLCRPNGAGRYTLQIGPVGAAQDPATVTRVYQFFSEAILRSPGSWWGADLLPNLPLVAAAASPVPPEARAAPGSSASPHASSTPSTGASTGAPVQPLEAARYDTLLLTDSPLAGSGELALGLRQLRALKAQNDNPGLWHEFPAAQAPSPATLLARCDTPYLLVLLQPELLATAGLPTQLATALASSGAACAVSADQRTATGEWAVGYSTQADVERYVARRQALPPHAHWDSTHEARAYMLDVSKARALAEQRPDLTWPELPSALAPDTVLAPRAFVHSWRDYQQGAREEMLDLLPESVQRLLDVGGGEGRFARAFVQKRGGQAWVAEPGDAIRSLPTMPGITPFQGRIDELDPARAGLFDAVSMLDVLEHISEPLAALLHARSFLRPGGLLLVSVPNVGHWSVVRDLAQGRFDYLPVGILCATHVRFFTQASLSQLLAEAGFKPLQWRHAGQPLPAEFTRFMDAGEQAGLPWDRQSLETESLHVLAARD